MPLDQWKSWKESPRVTAKPLWYEHYYDGPLDGVCEVDGEKAWYVAVDEEIEEYRKMIYAVLRLSPETATELTRRQDVFRSICGNHTDLDGRCEGG